MTVVNVPCNICGSVVSSYELERVDEVLSALTQIPSVDVAVWTVIEELTKRGAKDEDSVCAKCCIYAMHSILCNTERLVG